MNQLRQLMLEELHRRNFAATTIRCYLHGVSHFNRYFQRPPDQLGPEDIRKYQAGVTTVAILIWILTWGLLEWRWGKRAVSMSRVNTVSLTLLVLSIVLTFPPIGDLL